MLALLAGAVLLVGGSASIALLLAPREWSALFLATGTVLLAQVVLAAELLSAFSAVGRGGWLAAHALVAAGAALAWARRGRPRPPVLPRIAWREHPAVTFAVALAALAALLQLIVGLTTAPENWDSMTYHLSRAAYWLQYGSIGHFDGGSVRQLGSAPNAEVAVAWTMALLGRDTLVALPQWLALGGCATALWAIVRELGFPRPAAAFTAAVFVMLPQPIVQATTTQNDLVTSAIVLTTFAFGLRGLRRGSPVELAFAGIAFGLALGTKASVFFAVPALVLALGAALYEFKPPRRAVIALLAFAVGGAVVFGAFGYVANVAGGGSPAGGLADVARPETGRLANAARVSWSFVDSPGVGSAWVDRALTRTVAKIRPQWGIPGTVDTSTGEDTVAAGLVGWLVLAPLVLWAAFGRRRRPLIRALGLGALLYVALFGLVYIATPYNGRVLTPAVAIAAPLLAYAAARGWSRALVLVLAVAGLMPMLLTNGGKLLLAEPGKPNVWQLSREQQMTVSRPDQLPLIAEVERRFGKGSRIGFLGGEDSWDYPMFGAARSREVYRVDGATIPRDDPSRLCRFLRDFAARHRLDGLVFADAPREVPGPPPALGAQEVSPTNFVVDAGDLQRC